MESFNAGSVFVGITTCFQFAELATEIAEVGTENEVFVRTIQVVRVDLCEVERLISVPSVQTKLILTPAKHEWVRTAIHSTKSALAEIGKWVERAKVDQQAYGTVKFETRVRWVFNDHERLVNRQHELSACHQQLSNVLNYLVPLEDSIPIPPPPGYAQWMSFNDFLSPRQRRKTLSDSMAAVRVCATNASAVPADAVPQAEPTQMPNPGNRYEKTNQSYSTQSPPPSYTNAANIRHSSSELRRKLIYNNTQDLSPPDSYSYKEQSLREPGTKIDGRCDEKQSIRAYEYNASQTRTFLELEGNNLALGATNVVGPVDPFDMFTPVKEQSLDLSSTSSKMMDERGLMVSELIGDTYYPLELPAAVPARQSRVELQPSAVTPNEGSMSTPNFWKYESCSSRFRTQETHPSFGAAEPNAAVYSMPNTAENIAPLSTLSLPIYDRPLSAPGDTHHIQRSQDIRSPGQQSSYPMYAVATSGRPPLEQRSRTQPADSYSSRRMQNQKILLDILGCLDE